MSAKFRLTLWLTLMVLLLAAAVLVFVILINKTSTLDDPAERLVRTVLSNAEEVSFEDGSFVHKGEISETFSDVATTGFSDYNRALYIGDYVYVLSGSKFVSADIETLEITDELTFDTPQSYGAY